MMHSILAVIGAVALILGVIRQVATGTTRLVESLIPLARAIHNLRRAIHPPPSRPTTSAPQAIDVTTQKD